jgi:hypothetical protein
MWGACVSESAFVRSVMLAWPAYCRVKFILVMQYATERAVYKWSKVF